MNWYKKKKKKELKNENQTIEDRLEEHRTKNGLDQDSPARRL
jgi:hypothetical protein